MFSHRDLRPAECGPPSTVQTLLFTTVPLLFISSEPTRKVHRIVAIMLSLNTYTPFSWHFCLPVREHWREGSGSWQWARPWENARLRPGPHKEKEKLCPPKATFPPSRCPHDQRKFPLAQTDFVDAIPIAAHFPGAWVIHLVTSLHCRGGSRLQIADAPLPIVIFFFQFMIN